MGGQATTNSVLFNEYINAILFSIPFFYFSSYPPSFLPPICSPNTYAPYHSLTTLLPTPISLPLFFLLPTQITIGNLKKNRTFCLMVHTELVILGRTTNSTTRGFLLLCLNTAHGLMLQTPTKML